MEAKFIVTTKLELFRLLEGPSNTVLLRANSSFRSIISSGPHPRELADGLPRADPFAVDPNIVKLFALQKQNFSRWRGL